MVSADGNLPTHIHDNTDSWADKSNLCGVAHPLPAKYLPELSSWALPPASPPPYHTHYDLASAVSPTESNALAGEGLLCYHTIHF